jgi:hypothetical protein
MNHRMLQQLQIMHTWRGYAGQVTLQEDLIINCYSQNELNYRPF